MTDPQAPYRLRLTLPGLPSLINQSGNRHWAIRWRESKKWQRLVWANIPLELKPPAPLKKAKVTLTRVSAQKPDADNNAGGMKLIIDSLKICGLIEDDSPNHIETHFEWEEGQRNKGCVKILIEELPT